MGGGMSKGRNNDELVDNLIDANYIRTPVIESAFRSVDRGNYIPEDVHSRQVAYSDVAWRSGSIHLSASCIYSEVMESLSLKPGLSFLNIGSGTGYLSTMVGLILGPYGVNHGIEEKKAAVEFAEICLEKFSTNELPKLVHFNFCRPNFIVGNIFLWKPTILYDRIYCGAECPADGLKLIKLFLKINGILIIPIGNRLVKIVRVSTTGYNHQNITSVSFANLVTPLHNEILLEALPANPPTLMQLCISDIRNKLQRSIFQRHPEFRNMHRTIVKTERLLRKEDTEDNPDDSNDNLNKKRPPFDFYKPDEFRKPSSASKKVKTSDNEATEDPINDFPQELYGTNDENNPQMIPPFLLFDESMLEDDDDANSPTEEPLAFETIQNGFLENFRANEASIMNNVDRELRLRRRNRPGQRSHTTRFRRFVEAHENGQPSTSRGLSRSFRARLEMVNLPHLWNRTARIDDYEVDDSDTDSVNSHMDSCRNQRHRQSSILEIPSTRILGPLRRSLSPPRWLSTSNGFNPPLEIQMPVVDALPPPNAHPEQEPISGSVVDQPQLEENTRRSLTPPVPPSHYDFFAMDADDLPSSDSDSSSSISSENDMTSENESMLNDSDNYSDIDMETEDFKRKRKKLPPNKFSKFLKSYHTCLNNELNDLGLPYLLKNYIGYSKPDADKEGEESI